MKLLSNNNYKPKFCKDMTYEKINELLDFLELTRKREADLEQKKLMGGLAPHEEYELAMCKHDIKNLVRLLK